LDRCLTAALACGTSPEPSGLGIDTAKPR